jgi:hypothetical protein
VTITTPILRATATGLYFTLDGIPSHTPGWHFRNVYDLAKPGPTRSSPPDIIPGANGVIANPLWRDGNDVLLTGQAFGAADGAGIAANVYGSEMACLEENLRYLADTFGAIPANPTTTKTCVVHLASGHTRTGPVQVRSFDWDDSTMPATATLAMQLFIPAGHLPLDP